MRISFGSFLLALIASSASNGHVRMANAFSLVGSRNTVSSSVTATKSMIFSASSSDVSTTVTAARQDETDDSNPYNLSPEFQAAHKMAIDKLTAAIPSEKKDAMLPPLLHFVTEYFGANQAAYNANPTNAMLSPMATAQRILESIQYGMNFGMGENKYMFGSSHKALRGNPEDENGNEIDFYAFGNNFFKPCMNLEQSVVLGQEHLQEAMNKIQAGENVIFFANHQSEADPQVMSVLLEEGAGYSDEMAANVIYVAGHKVTTDPLAIPFSMGRNLICIHSKKHINADPEKKSIKTKQNLAAMGSMLSKLKAGGTAIWVAPSGGRDRRDVSTMKVPIANFDSKTIDMFRLMGNKSKKPTHYYPLSMVSYELCPPPDYVEAGVGEQRNVRFVPVGIACGPELASRGGLETRHEFCEAAQASCEEGYEALLEALEAKMGVAEQSS